MDSQYKLLSELLSDQAAFITSPKTSWRIIGGIAPLPPVSTGLHSGTPAHEKGRGGQNLFAGHYRYQGQIQEFLKEGAVM